MAKTAHFSAGLFAFLRDLAKNNDREWFRANQERYETQVKGPLLGFIGDLSKGHKLSRHFNADPRPVGGSMFRIHRDTRFAKDKSPYKTHVAAHFPHAAGGRDVHAPGFYLHLEPRASMGGGGLWHPDAPALKQVRDRIAAGGKDWKAVKSAGLEIRGETLKRPPPGYVADHPFIDDLKHKDFYCMSSFGDAEVIGVGFLDRYLEALRETRPLVAFLTRAVNLDF